MPSSIQPRSIKTQGSIETQSILRPGREYWKKFFVKYNTNGDGYLDKEEVKQAFKDLGSLIPSCRARRALKFADVNKDGFIDQEEIEALITYIQKSGFKLKNLQ